jgi:DNA modification methylase
VWSYPSANNFGRNNGEDSKLLKLHPTVKPVAMLADAIMDCTARGDLVLDSFLGSGSTLVAAEKVGRRCCGLEIDPLYVDLIIRRWQSFGGAEARHAETGRTFDELAAERGVHHG